MVRLPPAMDLIDLVLAVVNRASDTPSGGSVLVLVPSTGWAERLSARLVRRGYPVAASWEEARAGWPVVVGSRAAAWAPVPRLAAAIVLDAHDAAYREESAPTYSAVDVVVERARSGRGAVHPGLPGPTGEPGRPPGPANLRAAAEPGTIGLAGLRAGGPTRRRPPNRLVLRGVRPTGPYRPRRLGGPRPGTARVRLQPHGRRAAACLPALWRARPLCPLRRGSPASARRGGPALSPLRRDAARRVCALWPAAHEDLACRREPAARGTLGVARDRGRRGGRRRRVRRGRGARHAGARGDRSRPAPGAPRCGASPSSTSICICSRRGCRPPRRPLRSSFGPGDWSGGAAGRPGPGCRPRPGCRTMRVLRGSGPW